MENVSVRDSTALLWPGEAGAASPICSTNSPTGKANLALGFVYLLQGVLALSWSSAGLLAWLPKGPGLSPFGSEHQQSTLRFVPSTSRGFWPIHLSHSSAGCTNQCWGWAPSSSRGVENSSSRIPSAQLESPQPFCTQ